MASQKFGVTLLFDDTFEGGKIINIGAGGFAEQMTFVKGDVWIEVDLDGGMPILLNSDTDADGLDVGVNRRVGILFRKKADGKLHRRSAKISSFAPPFSTDGCYQYTLAEIVEETVDSPVEQ